jgi:hypothetical protein
MKNLIHGIRRTAGVFGQGLISGRKANQMLYLPLEEQRAAIVREPPRLLGLV